MKKLALLAAISALSLVGCGGSSDGDDDSVVIFPDASPGGGIDAGTTIECNPVSQTGCVAGEKCAFILDDPMMGIGHTGCIADGTAALGEACMNAANVGESDTCAAGGSCYQGSCNEICTAVNDTCPNGSCVPFNDLDFDLCLPNCDPIAQDCPAMGEACYLLTGGSVCAGVFMETPPGGECTAANGCSAGGGCFGDPGLCLRYCSLTTCPPQTDEMGNVVAWCGPDAVPACSCAGGAQFSGMECNTTESCQGIQGEDVVGVCADLSAG